ncbi:PTS transporter subunit EIIC, partial [bacterium]|nr:PTS transporter subunit EIIC [bacterium]
LVFSATLKQINEKIDMGVLGGIIIGLLSAYLYERFHQVKLPPFLAFFGGRRFPPLITAFASLFLGLLCGYIWLPVQFAIAKFGDWMVRSGGIGLFIYGTMNRLLIPFGLHHIINSLVWFQFGSYEVHGKIYHGDMSRFFAGDPTAGSFMAGFYPIMVFALPAVCLAMYQEAKPEKKTLVGGILLSSALTSIITGVTEPIEFSFMFLAPQLYALHSILTGSSLVVAHLLGAKSGFSFSAGLIDFLLNLGLAKKPWLLLLLGVLYFIIYYATFRFVIRRFNLPTPGREE